MRPLKRWLGLEIHTPEVDAARKGVRSAVHAARNEASKSIQESRTGKRVADAAYDKSVNAIRTLEGVKQAREEREELFTRMIRAMQEGNGHQEH